MVAAIAIIVQQTPQQLVVDVVRGVRLARGVEVAVRLDAFGPLGNQAIGLVAARRVTRAGMQACEA